MKKGKNRRRTSIRTKLIATMILITTIPLGVSIGISYKISTDKAMADAQDSLEWQAWYLEDSFSKILDSNISALKAFAVAPSTISYIKDPGSREAAAPAMLEQMDEIDSYMADGNITIISGGDGMQLLRSRGDCVDISDREYYQKAMGGTIYVSDIQISKSTGDRMITFAVPVTDGEAGGTIGIVQRNYNLSDLHEFLAGETSDAFILDRTGFVAAHAQYDFAGAGAHDPEDRSHSILMTSGLDEGFYSADTGKGYDAYVAYVKEPKSGFVVCTASDSKVVLAEARRSALIIFFVGIVMIIAVAGIALVIANGYAKPIRMVNEALGALAEGRFTMVGEGSERTDEFGTIVASTDAVAEKLKEVIGKTKQMTAELKAHGSNLAESVQLATDSSEQVSHAVDDISKGSVSQAENVQTAAQDTENMGHDIDAVEADIEQMNGYSQEMQESCDTVVAAMDDLIEKSETVTGSVTEIGHVIQATNDSANAISEFTGTIQDIAFQTNLLSLNASIEAARAGEQGKGFAVVAGEIRNLADQSNESANKIKEIVGKLLADAAESVSVMNELNENFTAQSEKLASTKDNMAAMNSNVRNVSVSAGNIAGRVKELNKAKANLIGIIEDLSAISEENAASTQETNASMEELSSTFEMINESAKDLNGLADGLDATISYFVLEDKE